MSYRSKRTRAISLSNDSHAANDASQGPPKKTSMSISITSLHNAASQQQKEVSNLSPTLQNLKLNNGRWGPFNPPLLNTTKTLQTTHELSKNVEPTKPSSGYEQPITTPKLDIEQKVAAHASKFGGIWKNLLVGQWNRKKVKRSPSSEQQPIAGNTKMNFQASSSQRRSLIPSWILDKPDFDDTVDVVTIDAEGNHSLVSGSIQAVDIWNNNGVRYYVQFNELHQPIRKGGQLLVKLIGSIAKQERYCPVGELDWHHIDEVLLAVMINVIRDRFVIPDGEIYINKILSRIAKVWRQYKSHLKSLYFKPQERSQEEHYNTIPRGISRDNWRKSVKYWLSEKGSFIEGTQAQDFLEDAKAKADILAINDGSKSRKEEENEVFESLMYGGEPPKRPKGFGFGVVKSNIYGVHGLLRKEGHGKVHKRPLENENVNITVAKNAELVKQNEVLEERVNQNTMLIMSLLEAMRNGKPSTELIDAAQSSLRVANPKVTIYITLQVYR
ncbi:Protein HIRA [Bienertia sinuspersici]